MLFTVGTSKLRGHILAHDSLAGQGIDASGHWCSATLWAAVAPFTTVAIRSDARVHMYKKIQVQEGYTASHRYFTSVLPEFEERARYYVQRAEQARKMFDPRLEKQMHSVAGVMTNLITGCQKVRCPVFSSCLFRCYALSEADVHA